MLRRPWRRIVMWRRPAAFAHARGRDRLSARAAARPRAQARVHARVRERARAIERLLARAHARKNACVRNREREIDRQIYRRLGVMRAALALPPNREIDFDCVCVACVRASERSCVSARERERERESPSVARARQRDLWVHPPSSAGRGPNQKFEQ